jgi:hypothetical protein
MKNNQKTTGMDAGMVICYFHSAISTMSKTALQKSIIENTNNDNNKLIMKDIIYN